MAKYHINPATGNPGVCRVDRSKPSAPVRGCPFGDDDKHYGSAEEARTAYEASMENEATPVATKPVDKKTLRLQAKTAVPTDQSFDKVNPFSWNEGTSAQLELIQGLSKEEQLAEGWTDERGNIGGGKWHSYFNSAMRASKKEGELNTARYAAALENDASDPRSISDVVASGSVDENSPRTRLSDAEHATASSIAELPRTTQEMVYKQPAAFLKVLADTPGGNSNVRALAQLSDQLRAKNPEFTPSRGATPPDRTSGRRSEDGVPQMQNMGPYGYGLLQSYAKEKFGERSNEFWNTVRSKTVNYPKISDFMRAVKEFK